MKLYSGDVLTRTKGHVRFEPTDDGPMDGRFSHSQYAGIAWSILGWETETDEDTEWSGMVSRTGSVVAVMVGDDQAFVLDFADFTRLDEGDYCHCCGQIGCTADGR